MQTPISDEELMAFADGALDEPRFSEVASAVEADAELARHLEELVVGGRAARSLYGSLAERPVPVRLRSTVESAIAARAKRTGWSRWQPIAAAAALAAIVAGPVGYLVAGNDGSEMDVAVGQPLPPGLLGQIEDLPSGAERRVGNSVFRPIATFTDASSTLCREFELDADVTTVAVACRKGSEWRVAIAIEAAPTGEHYVPASSLAALEAYLDSVGAGPPLPPEDERKALAR